MCIKKKTHISILHSNIESLNCNFEKLELLLDNIDYNFDVIGLTETWNSEEKIHMFNPGILVGYQEYIGMQGSTLKGGCGFYLKNGLNYIPRYDLDKKVSIDKLSEFECKWIEIINIRCKNTI